MHNRENAQNSLAQEVGDVKHIAISVLIKDLYQFLMTAYICTLDIIIAASSVVVLPSGQFKLNEKLASMTISKSNCPKCATPKVLDVKNLTKYQRKVYNNIHQFLKENDSGVITIDTPSGTERFDTIYIAQTHNNIKKRLHRLINYCQLNGKPYYEVPFYYQNINGNKSPLPKITEYMETVRNDTTYYYRCEFDTRAFYEYVTNKQPVKDIDNIVWTTVNDVKKFESMLPSSCYCRIERKIYEEFNGKVDTPLMQVARFVKENPDVIINTMKKAGKRGGMSAREVTLVGGSPWGFRMHGGHDLHQPLRISRVNPGSKAAQQGVREGDLISSINGRTTRDLTNSEAHALLRNAGEYLKLGLNQDDDNENYDRIEHSDNNDRFKKERNNGIGEELIGTGATWLFPFAVLETCDRGYGKDVAGKIEPRSGILAAGVEAAGLTNGSRLEDGNGSGELGRRQLEREYSEQLEALKFLVEPPACFRNVDEARQNLENKLNTLDLRRMNTIAIPTGESVFTPNPVLRGRMKNCGGNGVERMFQTRNSNFQGFCAGTMGDTRLNIERTVIDLFVRAPILKNRKLDGARRGVLFNANEGKTVRFKDEHDDAGEMLDEKESGERSAKNISLRETSEEMKNCELLEGTDVIDGIDRSEVSMNDGRTEELVRRSRKHFQLLEKEHYAGALKISQHTSAFWIVGNSDDIQTKDRCSSKEVRPKIDKVSSFIVGIVKLQLHKFHLFQPD
ncbi:PDZ and LIM domain protein 7 [Melipona quadrifasciata]|uniref:PDZ and LIM domain protein 7 n=1 Tax=Melipona quadrifasciata TaxID=166423 RepID=A0A0M9A3K3_9HYME|nr:PDZ and LIM domain protein 7 [Melipona quadrifasciata]